MKTTITIALIFAAAFLHAQTWHTINPTTGLNSLNNISMLNPGHGIAVGQNGVILEYNGTEWLYMESPADEHLNSVHYLNANAAWAVGDNGTIIHYNGSQWVQQNSNTTAKLNDVFFLSDDKGWAVGNTILHYDGSGWEVEMEQLGLNAVHFYDASEGWIVGNYGKTLKHDGNGWTLITGTINNVFLTDVVMTGPASGWKCGWPWGSGEPFYEYDGNNWNPSTNFAGPGYGLAFSDHDNGFALHNVTAPLVARSVIFRVHEGNWISSLTLGWAPVLTGIDHTGTDEFFVSTTTGIIYHHQNGTWEFSNGFADDHIYAIEFLTPSYGYVAAGRSGLLKYENGTWTTEIKLDDFRFEYVIFTEDGTGWAAGNPELDYGVTEQVRVFRYVDGEWEDDDDPFYSFFEEITSFYALDENLAWVGSWGSMLYRTAEGLTFGGPDSIGLVKAIYFENPESGWIAARKLPGWNGAIFRFQNGTWTTQYELTGFGEIEDFTFLNNGTGFAVGSNGLILHYDGTTWTELNSPTTVQLNTIKMIDNQTGWAGGEEGTLLYYDGNQWALYPQNLERNIYSICFPTHAFGLVGGHDGAFFATEEQLPVGIGKPLALEDALLLTIYPNPAKNHITFALENTEHHRNIELRCFNLLGMQQYQTKILRGQQQATVNVSAWPPGMYIAVVYSDGRPVGRGKFVVYR